MGRAAITPSEAIPTSKQPRFLLGQRSNGVSLQPRVRELLVGMVRDFGVAATARKLRIGRGQVLAAAVADVPLVPPALESHLTNLLVGSSQTA